MAVNSRKAKAVLGGLLTLAVCQASAQVYKWKDANGNMHFSDKVPPEQEKKAARVELRGVDVPEANRREAEDRAARAKAAASTKPAEKPARPAGNAPAEPVPPQASRKQTREERMAAFRDSQECFQQYRNVNGSLRPGAYEHCNPEMKEPSREE